MEDKDVDRPAYTMLNYITEGMKYMWAPGKTCKNEIMRGDMSIDRIRLILEYGEKNKDSWGRSIINEEGLKFLYTYNKKTIDSNSQLKDYIRELVEKIRKTKAVSDSKISFMNNETGMMEELIVNCVDIDWLN